MTLNEFFEIAIRDYCRGREDALGRLQNIKVLSSKYIGTIENVYGYSGKPTQCEKFEVICKIDPLLACNRVNFEVHLFGDGESEIGIFFNRAYLEFESDDEALEYGANQETPIYRIEPDGKCHTIYEPTEEE